jgi:hypothetical protein
VDASVLKSYLISLGWKIDNEGMQRFEETIRRVGDEIERHTSGVAGQFVKLAGTVTGAYAAVGAATVGLMDHVAQAELGYELFSMRMYVTTEMGKKMKIAMDALGHSMEEIFWNPELRERYRELVDDQARLQASLGIEFPSRMRQIRDLRFEFTRFRVELQYLAMQLVQSVAKAFGTDTEGLLKRFRDFNNWLITHLPEVADKIATQLVPVLKDTWAIMKDLYEVGKGVAEIFISVWQAIGGDPGGRIKKQNSDLENFAIVLREISGAIHNITDSIIHFKNAIGMGIGIGGGARLGAMLGSLFGPMGTVIGTLLGGTAGGVGAYYFQNQNGGGGGKPAPSADSSNAADQARELAKRVSEKTGISADWIFAQWAHETAYFTSNVFRKYHNLAGIRAGGQYQDFSSLSDSADRYAQILSLPRYSSARQARTMDDFAFGLKSGGYYEDSYSNYSRGMQRYQGQGEGGNTYVGGVQVHVTNPNATPDEIYQATLRALDDKMGKGNQRLGAEYKGAYTY